MDQYWFNFIQQNFLVYNLSWEDEKIDRELMEIDESSSICMLTGGGCNALSYLLDSPKLIHSLDQNYRQNALLDLKLNLLIHSFESFSDLFTHGKSSLYQRYYYEIRDYLHSYSRDYWDKHINVFSTYSYGFYHFGTCGTFSHYLNKALKYIGVYEDLCMLVTVPLESTQRKMIYAEIERKVFSHPVSKLLNNKWILNMLGIPESQSRVAGDLTLFIQKALNRVFCEQDPTLNPYWSTYLLGRYTSRNTPDYLKQEHQNVLRAKASDLNYFNKSLVSYLKEYSGEYSHFVLLDHLDWLDPASDEFKNSWQQILSHSRSGTKILLRSVHSDPDFFPAFVRNKVSVHSVHRSDLIIKDRVQTYAGTYLCEVI